MEGVEQLAQETAPSPRPHLAASPRTLGNATGAPDNATAIDAYYFFQEVQFTLIGVMLVAIVVGNASVIVALLFTKARKSRMNFFIMQLAIADLFVGLIFVTSDIVQRISITWYAGELLCKTSKFLQGVVMYASTYVLVALSIDRCDAITNPMNFSGSWNRARALVVSAWLLSVLCSIPLLVLPETKEINGRMQCWIELDPVGWRVWMSLVALTILVLPTIIIAACYTVIVLTIWTKSKAVMSPKVSASRKAKMFKNSKADGELDSRRASSRGLIPRAKIKSVKMSFVIVFVFILCWSPYIVFDLLQVYQWIPLSQRTIAWATLIQSLAPLNSVANPLICCLFSPHIYTGLSRLPPYKWLCRSRRSRSTIRSRSDSTAHTDLLSSTHVRRHTNGVQMLNARRNSNNVRYGDSRQVRMQLTINPRD